jgi:DNA end-binding protein Ku
LVRFNVEAINAHSPSGSDVHFHQLHTECHSRIKYQKVCPIHGEVAQDEIVLGYEYGRGKYVEIDPDELDELRTKAERALNVEAFIDPAQLDPIYYDGRMYFLSPTAANDREPYHLLRRALGESGQIGIGQVVFSGKEQLAAIRPEQTVLTMAMLNYAPEIRDAHALGVGEGAQVSAKNLRLAKELIRSMAAPHFSIGDYQDRYRKRVKELIAAKRKGKEIAAPENEEEPEVINLMDALKNSLSSTRRRTKKTAPARKRKRKAV